MTLQVAVDALQAKARAIPNVKEAPDVLTENVASFPFAATYPRTGTVDDFGGWRKGVHTIFVEFHVSRVLLGSAVVTVMSIMDAFENSLAADPKLSGSVDVIVFPLKYTFGRLEWGTVPTVGVRYEVTVKIQQAWT